MSKIRILSVPSDGFGVGHYRNIWPAQEIQKFHQDEFYVDLRLGVPVTDDDLGKFDIVHFHRVINNLEHCKEWVEKFKASGAIVIIDVDDYWVPFPGHPIRELVIREGHHLKLQEIIKIADWVTTTTEIYRGYLLKLNKNVHVIPNAVDHRLPMWEDRREPGDLVRVGWIGGSSHQRDLDRLKGVFNRLFNDPDLRGKFQTVLCGYDTRGTMTELNPITGEKVVRKIKPEESIWNRFEDLFSDFHRCPQDSYIRRKTLPITKYGRHYDWVDICLAPLDLHTFNECKSELKLIETGIRKRALIASGVYRYNELLTHGENALLVDPKRDHKDWYRHIKALILDQDMRRALSENLNTLVFPRYTLEQVTNERCDWYKSIISGRL